MLKDDDRMALLALVVMFLIMASARKRWRPSRTAFGTAVWASELVLQKMGMLAGRGLILGRTLSGKLLWLPHYCHVLLVGGTGSGKGVSCIIPILLSHFRSSIIVFDMKGDLYANTARRRGGRILRLAPFNGGRDGFNPLDTIGTHSPMLIDSARALAEALVVHQGTEPDPHWNDKAVMVITALIVLVLMRFEGEERSLNAVQEIASDLELVRNASEHLRKIGGIPERLGNQLKTLFDKDGSLSREGAGVISTVSRHLSFLDSDVVAKTVATSSFNILDLRKAGTTLYLQIPANQLEAQRGLLRCWISTFIRVLGQVGDESSQVLAVLDEASALSNLSAIEEALVRGRSAGVRLVLAYQSDSQVQTAFRDKKTLLYDNCSTQVYLGASSSYETAERISKTIGDFTQVVESYGTNNSRSWKQGGMSTPQDDAVNYSRGENWSYGVTGRALLKTEEVMTLDNGNLITFVRGMAPILARRILWYSDPYFRSKRLRQPTRSSLLWWAMVLVAIGVVMWGINLKEGWQWQRLAQATLRRWHVLD